MTMRNRHPGGPRSWGPGPELTEKKIAIAGQEVLGSGLHCPNAVTWAPAAVCLSQVLPEGGYKDYTAPAPDGAPPQNHRAPAVGGALSLSGLGEALRLVPAGGQEPPFQQGHAPPPHRANPGVGTAREVHRLTQTILYFHCHPGRLPRCRRRVPRHTPIHHRRVPIQPRHHLHKRTVILKPTHPLPVLQVIAIGRPVAIPPYKIIAVRN